MFQSFQQAIIHIKARQRLSISGPSDVLLPELKKKATIIQVEASGIMPSVVEDEKESLMSDSSTEKNKDSRFTESIDVTKDSIMRNGGSAVTETVNNSKTTGHVSPNKKKSDE